MLAPPRPSAAAPSAVRRRAAPPAVVASITIAAAVVIASLAGLVACATTDTTTAILPITGIIVRADGLVSELGCGRAQGNVYKYAAVVTNTDGVHVAGAVYDCFADAPFVDLTASASGSLDFTVDVFAYNQATYDRSAQSIAAAVADPAHVDLSALQGLGATWTTRCTATQQSQIEVLAVCQPLSSTAKLQSGVVIPTAAFAQDGADPAACGSAYTRVTAVVAGLGASPGVDDAGADASPDAAASPDADADASPTAADASAGSLDVACPEPIHFDAPPGHYDIDVTLTGGFLRLGTTCHADVVPRAVATATCDPASLR